MSDQDLIDSLRDEITELINNADIEIKEIYKCTNLQGEEQIIIVLKEIET